MHVWDTLYTPCFCIGSFSKCRCWSLASCWQSTAAPQHWLDRLMLLLLFSLLFTQQCWAIPKKMSRTRIRYLVLPVACSIHWKSPHNQLPWFCRHRHVSSSVYLDYMPICIWIYCLQSFSSPNRLKLRRKGMWKLCYSKRYGRREACDLIYSCCFSIGRKMKACVHQNYHTNRYYRIINTLFHEYIEFVVVIFVVAFDRFSCAWKRFSIHIFLTAALLLFLRAARKLDRLCMCAMANAVWCSNVGW